VADREEEVGEERAGTHCKQVCWFKIHRVEPPISCLHAHLRHSHSSNAYPTKTLTNIPRPSREREREREKERDRALLGTLQREVYRAPGFVLYPNGYIAVGYLLFL
jgi:hypothetical protein